MKLKTIRVDYSLTYNLGNYSNVRPSIGLGATLEEGEDELEARRALMLTARGQVEAEVDRALEQMDRPPEFFVGARYLLYYNDTERLAVLVRMAERDRLPECWRKQDERWRNHRQEFILGRFADEMAHHRFFEVVAGAVDHLPELVRLGTLEHESEKLLVLLPGDVDRSQVAKERGQGWWDAAYSGWTKWRLPEKRLAEAQAEANEKGWTFIDASDGDLEKLPFLKPEIDPVEVETDDDYDPFDNDYEDEDEDGDEWQDD